MSTIGRVFVRATFLVLTCVLTGCRAPDPERGFDSPDPAARLVAIAVAARTGDRSATPYLIESLDSDDPAVRLAAIRTLERWEGDTLGYDHAAPAWRRAEAVDCWWEWWRSRKADKDRAP